MRRLMKILSWFVLILCILRMRVIILELHEMYVDKKANKIMMPISNYEATGQYYESVSMILRDCGFSNIEYMISSDVKKEIKVGDIVEVSVNGDRYFSSGEKFAPDVIIRITYFDKR